MIPILTTHRLVLRPVTTDDFLDICAYGSDEETGRYMLHWPKTPEQIKEYIDECVASMSSTTPIWFEFSVIHKDTAELSERSRSSEKATRRNSAGCFTRRFGVRG